MLASQGSARAQQLEPGGSNYLAYYVTPEYLQGCKCNPPYDATNPQWLAWARLLYVQGGLEHVVGDYHRHPEIVQQQLRDMYARGQRKVSLFMHLLRRVGECLDLESPPPNVCHTTHAYRGGDGAWGLAIPLDSVHGGLLPQHLSNLKHLVADIRAAGFNQLNIRFAPFGELDPRGWRDGSPKLWDDYHTFLYTTYWVALRGAIDSVNAWAPEESAFHVAYDLSAEMAGYLLEMDGQPWNHAYSFGHTAEHSRRLWRDYLARYGNVRTIGFTFGNRVLNPRAQGWKREVVTAMNRLVYDSVGQRPSGYAFDIYPNNPGEFSGLTGCKNPCYDAFFAEIARQIRGDSLRSPQVLVWEGLYNDKRFAAAVREANAKLGLRIPYVMQWPSEGKPRLGHFSVVFPREYSNYLKLSAR